MKLKLNDRYGRICVRCGDASVTMGERERERYEPITSEKIHLRSSDLWWWEFIYTFRVKTSINNNHFNFIFYGGKF